MELSDTAREFILHWGEMGARWGVNRSVAQVHALLYLSPEPLTAETIGEQLSVARSNVSTSLRELQNWNLVQVSHHMGDRRDFFSTSHDIWRLFLTVIEQRVEREIEPTIAALGKLAAARSPARDARKVPASDQVVTERVKAMHDFLQEMHDWYGQMSKLPAGTLRSLIGIGAGITRWLPARTRKGEAL